MKHYSSATPSRRHMSTITYRGVLSGHAPHKPLLKGGKRHVGRNSFGRITTRHKGGGHKRLFRDVDFFYSKYDIPAKVESVEYDPNRSGFVSPIGTKVGDTFLVSENAPLKPGNRLPLRKIPTGTFVFNIEIHPRGGAKLVRSAGNYAEVLANDAGFTNIKMPSTEVRKVNENAWATIGSVSNPEYNLQNWGKAGASRHRGVRPTVRGTAMNPVDHPYGGGEGVQGRGTRRAKSKWGKPTGKGQKTRTPKKYSNVFIVSRRRVGGKKTK